MRAKECFLFILLLSACTRNSNTFQPEQRQATCELAQFVIPADTERQRLVNEEVKYYLDRHDPKDEGYSTVTRYVEKGESSMSAFLPHGRLTLSNMLSRHSSKTLMRDVCGRLIIGRMVGDSLISGIRIDSAGFFAGQMNLRGEAWGNGIYRSADGTYFEGLWEHDQREGFGISVGTDHLHVGEWKYGFFRGEHFLFHDRRIYGIDISRYQHEKGRRHFPVSWSHPQVRHFGRRISTARVLDNVDYPVSFVYIKSTEGVTIENRYYEDDDEQVRQLGIPVGAYHFFSTRTSAAEQARHFLEKTHIRKGDLPPMLDVEPSDMMIAEMGGPSALFESMRIWLNIVERATHTRPILYYNQRFAHTYLSQAPDLQNSYRSWVARYSEYKPDVHHDIWQLSGDGRVNGFIPDVDINVFNGYQDQWNDFLRNATVR